MDRDMMWLNGREGRCAGRTTASLQHAARIFVAGQNVVYVTTTQHTAQAFRQMVVGMIAALDPGIEYEFESSAIRHPTKKNWLRFESLGRSDRHLSRRGLPPFVQIPDHGAFEVLDSENERLSSENRKLAAENRALEEKLTEAVERLTRLDLSSERLIQETREAISKFERDRTRHLPPF